MSKQNHNDSAATAAGGTAGEEPLSFDPYLSQIESHRIIAVIEKALERLQLLALLSHEVSTQLESASNNKTGGGAAQAAAIPTGGDDSLKGVGGILEHQQRLEGRYEELLTLTAHKKHNPLEPKLEMSCFKGVENLTRKKHMEELRSLSTHLKEQARQLCSQLKENPNDVDNWRRVVEQRSGFIAVLSTAVQELSTPATTITTTTAAASPSSNLSSAAGDASSSGGGITLPFQITMRYESFARHVLGEQHDLQTAEEIVKREKDTNQSVKKLHQDVALEKQKKEQELEQRNVQLSDLKQQLRLLKQQTKEDMDRYRAETEAKRDGTRRAALDVERQLKNQIDHLAEHKELEVRVSDVVVTHSTAKSEWLDEQNAYWTAKQIKAVRELGEEKHRAETERKQAKDRLDRALEQKYIEDGEKKRREEEAKRVAGDKQRRDDQRAADYAASSKLQCAFKAFMTRQALVAIKKKKKGKK